MRFAKSLPTFCLMMLAALPAATAQVADITTTLSAPSAATSATVVPMLVRFEGVAVRGGLSSSSASITFLIYKDEKGGDPLWVETQSVATDALGKYEVYLGSTYSSGLPPGLFGTGEARWLEVQITGGPTTSRTLLTSVPYALKAADAATLGGLPASAFALAGTTTTSAITSGGITSDAASNVTTTGGTSLYLPKFNAASTVIDSEIYDTGTSVGIGDIPNATAKLDVNGPMIMRGNMTVSRTGNATASKAYPSYGFDFFSNAYNSSTKASDNPYFQLQSEPTGNDTSSPSATFNLLFSNNGSAPAETGLSINPNGTIKFASGQTFPGGSGSGTITGVTPGFGLTGGGASGNVTLSVATSAIPTLTGNNTFTGTDTFTASINENTDINIDNTNSNGGNNVSPGLRFGSASGEGISSGRTDSSTNQYGLDFYTDYAARMSITEDGLVGVGTQNPGAQFEVDSGDDGAATFVNDSQSSSTVTMVNSAAPYTDASYVQPTLLNAVGYNGGFCYIDITGELVCNSSSNASSIQNGERTVKTFAVQSAESWYEDAGSGELVNGSGHVDLEPTFGQTVNTGIEYHVFLTPDGDCKGLYVAHKSASGFDVRELGGGKASVPFEYRIMAKRMGHESERLVDLTQQSKRMAAMAKPQVPAKVGRSAHAANTPVVLRRPALPQ